MCKNILSAFGGDMRENEKRLSVAVDGATYRRLRLLAIDRGATVQKVMEAAVIDYLDRTAK
jgi:predicted transcriptional regulator